MKASEIVRAQYDDNKAPMQKFTINGKLIKTNLCAGEWKVWNGNDYPKNGNVLTRPFRKSTYEWFDELIESGYTSIRFVETTTCVRGYHEVHAVVFDREIKPDKIEA